MAEYKIIIKEILNGKSLARSLVNAFFAEIIKEKTWLSKDMRVLELGAESASHQKFFPKEWRLYSSNYKKISESDMIIDAENKFPLADNEFNGVVCLNTVYAIKNYNNCFSESLRVAENFILFHAPLIQAIIPHPLDFTRLTEDGIKSLIGELKAKFKVEEFEIMPVGGSFSSAVSLIDPYLKFRILRLPVYLTAIFLDRLDKIIKRKCPMMYLILIKKHE